jgi:hypothetical protein
MYEYRFAKDGKGVGANFRSCCDIMEKSWRYLDIVLGLKRFFEVLGDHTRFAVVIRSPDYPGQIRRT